MRPARGRRVEGSSDTDPDIRGPGATLSSGGVPERVWPPFPPRTVGRSFVCPRAGGCGGRAVFLAMGLTARAGDQSRERPGPAGRQVVVGEGTNGVRAAVLGLLLGPRHSPGQGQVPRIYLQFQLKKTWAFSGFRACIDYSIHTRLASTLARHPARCWAAE